MKRKKSWEELKAGCSRQGEQALQRKRAESMFGKFHRCHRELGGLSVMNNGRGEGTPVQLERKAEARSGGMPEGHEPPWPCCCAPAHLKSQESSLPQLLRGPLDS